MAPRFVVDAVMLASVSAFEPVVVKVTGTVTVQVPSVSLPAPPRAPEDRITLDKHILLLSKYSRNQSQTHAEVYFMNQLEERERSL
jgi:hypothetical protein